METIPDISKPAPRKMSSPTMWCSEIAHENRNKMSLRLKVTNKCPWNCIFCHREGGWRIDDIVWSSPIKNALKTLKEKLGISEVHFTGGEPTSHRHLPELTAGIVSLGLKVKTTSNGQFGECKLLDLMNSGLSYYNFSVLSLDPEEFLKSQRTRDLSWAHRNIEHQEKIIKKAIALGASVKINTVLSSKADIKRAVEVYKFAKTNNVLIRFLNDLSGGHRSVDAIEEMAVRVLQARRSGRKAVSGSSSVTTYFKDGDGFEFGVKGIRAYKLSSLCMGCRLKCTEHFYGVRMEQKNGRFFIRLCLNRNDEKSLMPLERFLVSDQLREIKGLPRFDWRKAA